MTALSFVSELGRGGHRRKGTPARKPPRSRLGMEALENRSLLSANVLQTNLVSDLPGIAQVQDPNLVNPWGISESSTSPFWISDNNAGVSTLYSVPGAEHPGLDQPAGCEHPDARQSARRRRNSHRDRVQHRRGRDGGIHRQRC